MPAGKRTIPVKAHQQELCSMAESCPALLFPVWFQHSLEQLVWGPVGCGTEGMGWSSLAVTGTVEHGPHTESHTQTLAGVVMRRGERFTTGSSSVLRGDMKNPRRFITDYEPAQFYFCNFCNS